MLKDKMRIEKFVKIVKIEYTARYTVIYARNKYLYSYSRVITDKPVCKIVLVILSLFCVYKTLSI